MVGVKLTHIPYEDLDPESRAEVDEMVESNRDRVAWFHRVLGDPSSPDGQDSPKPPTGGRFGRWRIVKNSAGRWRFVGNVRQSRHAPSSR